MKTNIETERLRIRNFADKDAEGLLAYLAHPRANCFTNERLGSLKEAAADVARRSKDKLQYAVCLKEEDSIIGNLFAVKEEPDTYSVGWNFNECYEGKGYASEAARAFLSFLFSSPLKNGLWSRRESATGNFGNKESKISVGFRPEGRRSRTRRRVFETYGYREQRGETVFSPNLFEKGRFGLFQQAVMTHGIRGFQPTSHKKGGDIREY